MITFGTYKIIILFMCNKYKFIIFKIINLYQASDNKVYYTIYIYVDFH